ncbi:MAG: NAD-dependent epimerase/dehydratase family protein, partial [Candidatus Berkiella sp.]
MKSLLITGGAGFVGSSLALLFKQFYEDLEIICFDNLSRRGSELNLSRLKQHGIKFVHGDVRNKEDLFNLPAADWLIECSAEPSVHAGFNESPMYLINTNLNGLINCLEFSRLKGSKLLFLSTSRVYPIKALRELPLANKDDRFVLSKPNKIVGLSENGISEEFTLNGTRSLYGATKLSAELFIQEYCQMYNLKAVINRCGVLAGP